DQERWLQNRRNVFTPEFINCYAQEVELLYGEYEGDGDKEALLKALFLYAH
ncbi:exodeoxyribonuclease I, partial [Enterobacter hormaechei]